MSDYIYTFNSNIELHKAVNGINILFNTYGYVAVSDVNTICGKPSTLRDDYIGWTNLKDMKIAEDIINISFSIDLGEPIDIKYLIRPAALGNENIKPSNVERHATICRELTDLYERKNHDYGDAFHDTFVEEGFAMARIRLTDKLNRFKTLSKDGERAVTDESIRDTLIDLANYAIMTVMEMDRNDTVK